MNILSIMDKVSMIGKYLVIAVLTLNLVSLVNASAVENISTALSELCNLSRTFLGAAIMIMIILAGATYAIGQVLGAETRARASVWATAMLTGAIVGALIYVITPFVVGYILGAESGTGGCDFALTS